ncbi:alpha-galactosidase [Actinospongicola halichondriae]|uniref:alpha-galactosidase n=1 Tax=Actinospongicola halichondriae TaxID=3236844 RepID=UPI003D5989AC
MDLHLLGDADSCLVIDTAGEIPAVVHWGPDPGPLDTLPDRIDRPRAPATLDREPHLSLVPLDAGFAGRLGLECHRADGPVELRHCETRWSVDSAGLRFEAVDEGAGVTIVGTVRVDDVITVDLSVVNTAEHVLFVDHLAASLPLPDHADEILRLTGQWCAEFQPLRIPWPLGTHLIETTRGRTSHDSVPVAFFGPTGFGEHDGEVRGVHLAWSGNHAIRIERLPDGRRHVQAGEALAPGEVALGPGERHDAPTLLATTGQGLTACSQRLHRHVRRSLPDRPRPVLLNTWEAVYFDHDFDRLTALADRAASVGVERFVLDDGWFGGRRDDTAGLGDWFVSPDAHPDGLGPLIDHVTGLGMEFGIWVEPEMVNPDSDLFRAHPDWVLGDPAVTGRNQLVLDLTIEDCWSHLFDALDRLLTDHDIAFVKWDMNRDVATRATHGQTLALYRLLDALGTRHPDIEIESCASGGGRADAGILQRTQRIWTSDCNDPLERQTIQRGFSTFLPPAVMGAHIGPPRAHTTGRTHRLGFRAGTALFGHLGIEWNLLEASDRDLDKVRAWVALHKELRPLLHSGDVVRLDPPDDASMAHGVVAPDRSSAVFSFAQLATSQAPTPPLLRLRGLDPRRTYSIRRIAMPGDVFGMAVAHPSWITGDGVDATGESLGTIGIQMPRLFPESVLLLRLDSVD